MPYYTRSFCTATRVPLLSAVLASLRQLGFNIRAEVENPADLDSDLWVKCELIYKNERNPIVVECNRVAGKESLAAVESREFTEELEKLAPTPERAKVIRHLEEVQFIIACQLPLDIDSDGFDVSGEFLDYFVNHCGGMIHADGEGFYVGGNIHLAMD